MASTTLTAPTVLSQPDFVDRLIDDLIGCFDTYAVYLGMRLGLYQAVADLGRATPRSVAARAGIDERYAREWLEHQAAAGLLAVDESDDTERVFDLPEPLREVLLDELSPFHAGPLAYAGAAVARVLPALLDSFRSGDGVPFAAYGQDIRDHIERLNRPMYVNDLAASWLPAMPDLDQRLRADPPAAVLDIACGSGWSAIVAAQAYPRARVLGVDLDPDSIDRARANAEQAGVQDRVTFEVADVSEVELTGPFDVAFVFEALHDLPRPVDALAGIRRALRPGGSVLVGDEKVAPSFVAPGDQLERLVYGFSLLHCLPAARMDRRSVATGAVMRPAVVERYAAEAGFTSVEIAPIEHDMWRFYRLR